MSQKKIEKGLFFLCLILLPTQLGKHFWPGFSYIYSLPVDYLSPILYLWDILVASLLVVWLWGKPKLNFKALNLILIFLFCLILSVVGASNIGASLTGLIRLIFASMLGFYLSNKNYSKKTLSVGLGLAVGWSSVLAVLEFINGSSLNLWILGERSFSVNTPAIATFNFFGQVFLRPYSSFPHPNVLAAFLIITLPIIFKESFWWVYILGATAALLSFSRGAILFLVIESWFYLRERLKLLLTIAVILAPVLFIRFNSAFNFDNLSILRREDLAEVALIDFKSSPILGVGLNNFINQTANSNLVAGPSRFLQPVHNIYLLLLAETGFVGLLGFGLLVSYPLLKTWKDRSKFFSKKLIFAWIIIFSLGMIDHYFLTLPQGQRLFFLIWGLSW